MWFDFCFDKFKISIISRLNRHQMRLSNQLNLRSPAIFGSTIFKRFPDNLKRNVAASTVIIAWYLKYQQFQWSKRLVQNERVLALHYRNAHCGDLSIVLSPHEGLFNRYEDIFTLNRCLTTPSHYQNRCWLIIKYFCGIHLRASAHEPNPKLTCAARLRVYTPVQK